MGDRAVTTITVILEKINCDAIVKGVQKKTSQSKILFFAISLTQRCTHHPPQNQLVYSKLGRADKCPASKQGPSVQVYSHTQTSEATLYYVFAAEQKDFDFFCPEFKNNYGERSSGYQVDQ